MVSRPQPTRSSWLRVRCGAPRRSEVPSRPGPLVRRRPRLSGWLTRGRERGLSGLQAIRPVPLRRSTTPVEPTCPRPGGHIDAVPAFRTAKTSALADFGAHPPLRHLLSYTSRGSLPPTCKAGFRLAGWAFTGRESNPLDRGEGFQLVLTIILPSCSPDASGMRCPAFAWQLFRPTPVVRQKYRGVPPGRIYPCQRLQGRVGDIGGLG
jgi:hypothetical protein